MLAAELTRFCSEAGIPQSLFNNIAVSVGGHHGVFPTNWDGHHDALGNLRWAEIRVDVLSELARLFNVCGLAWPRPSDDQSVWMFVAGLTSVADWIGSNVEFFPPVGSPALLHRPFNVDEYFSQAGRNAGIALEELGWLHSRNENRHVTIADFLPEGREPRPLQTAVAGMASAMSEPSLVIVEAPMGEGKTEAAWYAAACWDRQGGQGAYVALPTLATSNQMFDRVGKFLEADAGGNLMLLHGKAALNEQFEKLGPRRNLWVTWGIDEEGSSHA